MIDYVDINLFYQLASISLVESSKQLGINLKWKIQETLSMIAIHFNFSPPPMFLHHPLTESPLASNQRTIDDPRIGTNS